MEELKKIESALNTMAEAKGIKETLEVLDLLDQTIAAYELAKADGKFDINDFAYITPVIISSLEAFKGSELIIEELKDLDTQEATQIFQRVFSLCQKLLKALTAKEVAVPVMFPSA